MTQQPPTFLSCDWGTTAFRMRLVTAEGYQILAEESSKQGSAIVNEEWKKAGRPEEERMAYYLDMLMQSIKALEVRTGEVLDGIPLIISGMASSTIGMKELPYKDAPFLLNGADLKTEAIKSTARFPHDVLLISGVKTDDDVMRGEEVQVVGCEIGDTPVEQIIIHPGTHSKHIIVKGGQAVSFKTYMTGELFSLLSTKSILAASINPDKDTELPLHEEAFAQGIKDAEQNLLHALFRIRTADLFGRRTKEEAHHYLSGLLIGTELQAFPKDYAGEMVLAGEPALVAQYRRAMELTGITQRISGLILKDATGITLRGQYAVYLQQKDARDDR